MAWYEILMRRTYASLLNYGNGSEMWPQAGPIIDSYADDVKGSPMAAALGAGLDRFDSLEAANGSV